MSIATTPYLRLRLRSMSEALDDIANGNDSRTPRVQLWDESKPRRLTCECGCRLEDGEEKRRGECRPCVRARWG